MILKEIMTECKENDEKNGYDKRFCGFRTIKQIKDLYYHNTGRKIYDEIYDYLNNEMEVEKITPEKIIGYCQKECKPDEYKHAVLYCLKKGCDKKIIPENLIEGICDKLLKGKVRGDKKNKRNRPLLYRIL